ncbi:TetR/AcrR family transcriptional regulator [Thalassotalea mangrovi]|uniref:TetR/AcrR family transcriptional regulator n=1 Tax=Thalassotalea mangrovi TaxID=2572245 RepID=UPI001FE7E727|nr:TetR/AcrR family transcriptional regulator [Thalassotalea mangrovi]
MSSPKTRSKSEEKRQQIYDAAAELFCEKGFSATSMDLVAKTAGVSKQTVYSHFGSKDDLFVATISARCEEFISTSTLSPEDSEPYTTLCQYAEHFLALLLSPQALAIHRICINESTSYPHVSRLFYQAGPQRVIAEVRDILAGYKRQDILAIGDVHTAAIQFLSMIKGEIWMQKEYNIEQPMSIDEVKRYIAASVRHFLRGYGYKLPPANH